jgi:Xaa-Pro aminopeptidase
MCPVLRLSDRRATAGQKRAYQAALAMFHEVTKAAKPGVPAIDLVKTASATAKDAGFDLYLGFVGHGLGLDVHERPELVREDTKLAANMVLAVEPRVVIDDAYMFGVEDAVLVTDSGGESLNSFEKEPLEI